MKTVILAGGLGTRLAEETVDRPKPMVEVGDRPILWHIMNLYAAYDHREFVIALGYRGDVIKRYFLDYCELQGDLTISLERGTVDARHAVREPWTVQLVDTGLHTDTGGRIRRAAKRFERGTFLATYGDGVANVDVKGLLEFHRRHGKLATLTAVRPPARFGSMTLDGDQVSAFVEKPQIGEGWINGGFFVLEPEVLEYIEGDTSAFEREPLDALARDGELMAYRHPGFWQCMDTLRDKRTLNALWDSGEAPWMIRR